MGKSVLRGSGIQIETVFAFLKISGYQTIRGAQSVFTQLMGLNVHQVSFPLPKTCLEVLTTLQVPGEDALTRMLFMEPHRKLFTIKREGSNFWILTDESLRFLK